MSEKDWAKCAKNTCLHESWEDCVDTLTNVIVALEAQETNPDKIDRLKEELETDTKLLATLKTQLQARKKDSRYKIARLNEKVAERAKRIAALEDRLRVKPNNSNEIGRLNERIAMLEKLNSALEYCAGI